MKLFTRWALVLMILALLVPGAMAQDQDKWKFGIGIGLSSLALDGDIGFPGAAASVPVDLSNSDTSDLIKSGFGAAGFARKGKWSILYKAGRLTLEDDDAGVDAEWDRDQVEVLGGYNFAQTGKHSWGALFGVRYVGHEWKVKAPVVVDIDEGWTDGVIGLTHFMPISEKWSWSNRLDVSGGDSEGTGSFSTAFNWRVAKSWSLAFSAKMQSLEFEEGSPGDPDWYLYDVDETSIGVGVTYTF